MAERNHFVALDSLRGICASIVALYHFHTDAWLSGTKIIQHGFLFVDFFFVLSGFVIAANYSDKIISGFPIRKFLFLRLGRLYPLYIFMLAAYLALAVIKTIFNIQSGLDFSIAGFWANVFMVQAWIPKEGSDFWNPAAWSISTEFWAYLAFALNCRMAKQRNLIIFVALISAAFLVLWFGTDRYLGVTSSISAFARCIYSFGFGVITYAAWRRLKFNLSAMVTTMIELSVCGLGLLFVFFAGPSSMLAPPAFAAAILILAQRRGYTARFLEMGPLVLIGALSYSIYMVHEFLLARLFNVLEFLSKRMTLPVVPDPQTFSIHNAIGYEHASIVTMAIFYGLVFISSLLTYKMIEEPCREKSRKLANELFRSKMSPSPAPSR